MSKRASGKTGDPHSRPKNSAALTAGAAVLCAAVMLAAAFIWYPPLWRSGSAVAAHLPFLRDTDGRVNINTAPLAELTALPGIGEKRATAIIEYRGQNGGFENCGELLLVNGIGEGILKNIEDMISCRQPAAGG